MLDLLGKRFKALLITCCSFITLGSAQSDAIIIGKVDSPQSRVVRFEYKRNHFSLEEGSFEAILDTNNVFAIRVKLDEPRAVFCTHRENAVKLFVTPGDTLKMRFTGGKMSESLVFDGSAALHNDYLVKTQRAFPDWLNENALVKARIEKGSKEYLAYTDSIFLAKRRFFDTYPSNLKENFTNDFLEFATNDINYWRAYELMLYVKTYGLNNSEPLRMINDDYFNFTLEMDNIYYKALNNEYYLQYLELYLGYLSEKNGLGHKEPLEIVEEKSRSIKTVKPLSRNIRVIEEPFLPRDVVSWLAPNEEAIYQNLLTGEKFKYVGEDSTYEDIFLKIKTIEGKTGWVPQSAIAIYEKTITERIVRNRFCFLPDEPLCGFDKHLSGKVLYFTVAKDILYSCMYDKLDVIDVRVKKFVEKNPDHKEYNNIVNATQALAIEDRNKGLNRLNIPPSCEVDEYWKDRIYYAKNLSKLRKNSSKTDFVEDIVIDYAPENTNKVSSNNNFSNSTKTTAYVRPVSPTVTNNEPISSEPTQTVSTPVKPSEPTQTVSTPVKPSEPTQTVSTPVKPSEPAQTVSTPVKPSEPTQTVSTPVKPNEPTQTVSTPVKPSEPTQTVSTPVKPNEPAQTVSTPVKPNEPTQTVNTPVKPSEPAQTVSTPVKPSEPAPAKRNEPNYSNPPTVNYSGGSGNIRFVLPEGFIPFGEYDPSGKPVEFKGMVINEAITPFEFTDIENNVFRQQDHLGKIVVLDFWATWCGPCKPTIEYTQRLANKYSDKEVIFVYISADSDEGTWKEYLKEHPLKGIQGRDDNALIRINQRVPGVPNYFVIDKKGRIAFNSLIESKQNAEEMIDILLKTP